MTQTLAWIIAGSMTASTAFATETTAESDGYAAEHDASAKPPPSKPPPSKPPPSKPPPKKPPPKKPAPKKGPEWIVEPFAEPSVGVTSVTVNGDTGVQATGGGEAGYWYKWTGDPPLYGETRIAADLIYSLTAQSIGYDLRIGSFIGPSLDDVTLTIGPDLFYNGYGTPESLDYYLPATGGLSINTQLTIQPIKEAGIVGLAAPSWIFNPERRAGNLGPFHELTLMGGLQLNSGNISGMIGYQATYTAVGVTHGVVISGQASDLL